MHKVVGLVGFGVIIAIDLASLMQTHAEMGSGVDRGDRDANTLGVIDCLVIIVEAIGVGDARDWEAHLVSVTR